jgi:hypothetical protein
VTRQGAIETGQGMAVKFGKDFVVYRFKAWPADCYGVIAVDRLLPIEAETFEILIPNQPEPVGQGSLFQ